MTEKHLDIIRRHSRQLAPIPTGHDPVMRRLDGIRAVLFDVYGTMFVSSSGDIGASAEASRSTAMADALDAVDPVFRKQLESAVASPLGQVVGRVFLEKIGEDHERKRASGIEHPEVDIVHIWRETLDACCIDAGVPKVTLDCQRLALEYEFRVNPVWPMPDLGDCLGTLRAAGIVLGIISNAQFYTPLLFSALLNESPKNLAFAKDMQYYSYRFGEAKPSATMYQAAAHRLHTYGLGGPEEVLFVGNDMLNDMMPAAQIGFRTALFAGDRRSLRMREGDPRVAIVKPDLVITDLNSLTRCVC